MAKTAVNLSQLLAIKPEHVVPAPGNIVDLAYERAYEGGEMPIRVRVTTDVAGIATFTVTADAEEVAYSLEAARKALARSTGNDPDQPGGIERARAAMGAQAFEGNVVYLVKQRLLCLAYMRTGILPFLAPEYPPSEAPAEGRELAFTARVRLRPRGRVEDFSPVSVPFPAKREVTDKEIDEFIGQMLGGAFNLAAIPDEAKAGMERLRGQAREACEKRRDGEWWGDVMEAVADDFARTRLTAQPGVRYVTQLAELMANQLAEQLERSGTKWSDFTARPDFDMDAFKDAMMENAELSLSRGLALDAVAAHAGIRLTQDDVLETLSAVARGTESVAAQAIIDNGQLPQVIEVALRAKASNWLAENAVDTRETEDGAE